MNKERFAAVLDKTADREYCLQLKNYQVFMLHGLATLMVDNPGLQEMGGCAIQMARYVRDWCLGVFRDMDFSDAEVKEMDTLWERRDPEKGIHLGPRMLIAGGETLGTIDDLSLVVAEATPEEMEKLRSATSLTLVRMSEG